MDGKKSHINSSYVRKARLPRGFSKVSDLGGFCEFFVARDVVVELPRLMQHASPMVDGIVNSEPWYETVWNVNVILMPSNDLRIYKSFGHGVRQYRSQH